MVELARQEGDGLGSRRVGAFVVVVAFRQDDGMGALFLGLAREALLLGVALLILHIAPRRKSPASGEHEH